MGAFALGFCIGMVVGACIGFLVLAFCVAASRN